MTRQVLFVQGAGGDTHEKWDIRLVGSLRRHLGADFAVRYPPMPDPEDPAAHAWITTLRQEFIHLRNGDVLVGHSFGGTMLLHALKEAPPFAPAALMLLASPFYGVGGWEGKDMAFDADLPEQLPASLPIHAYHGHRDEWVPFAHLALFGALLPGAATIALPEADHQFNDDLTVVAQDIKRLVASGAGAAR